MNHQSFHIDTLLEQHQAAGKLYFEFLRVPSMSMGVYILKAGSDDPQQPHGEDEVYYVLSGRGKFWVGGKDVSVTAGSTLFVAADESHHFHSIEEDLTLLVFFAPPEAGG
ncbi:cupin domain-containing protein [Chloroflexi bacterium TSY]|nr:cupin domain-containing protein [Chloroflexi bacterium TSY]